MIDEPQEITEIVTSTPTPSMTPMIHRMMDVLNHSRYLRGITLGLPLEDYLGDESSNLTRIDMARFLEEVRKGNGVGAQFLTPYQVKDVYKKALKRALEIVNEEFDTLNKTNEWLKDGHVKKCD